MRETPVNLIAVGIGAFLAGLALGLTAQWWIVDRIDEADLEAKFQEGRESVLAERDGADGCHADGVVFRVGIGDTGTHCSSGSMLAVGNLTANGSMWGTVGETEIAHTAPRSIAFTGTDGADCNLILSGVTGGDTLEAMVSFRCDKGN